MSRLLPARYAAGSGWQSSSLRLVVRSGRPALVSRLFSTTIPTACFGSGRTRQQHTIANSKEEETIQQDNGEGIAQQSEHIRSRTPRYSISNAGPNLHPQEANHPDATDASISPRAPVKSLRKEVPHEDNGKVRGGFRPPGKTKCLPPLGTLPRDPDLRTETNLEEASSREITGDSESQKRDHRKSEVPKDVVIKTSLEDLPLHRDLFQTVTENPHLYGATAAEAASFHHISSDTSVFIQQRPGSRPAYFLPIIQKLINNEQMRPGFTVAAPLAFQKQMAKMRPISVLILSHWPQASDTARMAKLLLTKFRDYRVCCAFPGGMPFTKKQRVILDGCDILVAHPRTLATILTKFDPKEDIHRRLRRLHTVVVEDADLLVREKHMDSVHQILSKLSRKRKEDSQPRPRGVISSVGGPTELTYGLTNMVLGRRYEYIDGSRKGQPEVRRRS